jgi:hypothetical protein
LPPSLGFGIQEELANQMVSVYCNVKPVGLLALISGQNTGCYRQGEWGKWLVVECNVWKCSFVPWDVVDISQWEVSEDDWGCSK